MSNQFKKKAEVEEELEVEPISKSVSKEDLAEGSVVAFLRKFFTEGVVSKESATEMLPFLLFLSVLGMIYIANSHMAMSNIRAIDKLNREVTELGYEYKSLKASLMFKSKQTEVAKKVDTLGIKQLIEPPKKIVIESEH